MRSLKIFKTTIYDLKAIISINSKMCVFKLKLYLIEADEIRNVKRLDFQNLW